MYLAKVLLLSGRKYQFFKHCNDEGSSFSVEKEKKKKKVILQSNFNLSYHSLNLLVLTLLIMVTGGRLFHFSL